MDAFTYRQNELYCEDLPAEAIAEAVGTPCYVYSRRTITDHYDRLREAFAALDPLICYSIKSCGNISICRLLAERGAGMDLVSGGELHRALRAGVGAADCVYAGVGKTDQEIRRAIEAGIGWFNIESEAEFENISAIAREMNATCRGALRINPDVDPRTHRYTTTGKKETKFGVDLERARAAFQKYGHDAHCRLSGIHLHLGSPIYSADPYVESIHKVLALMDELNREESIEIEMLDLGGGFGANYTTDQSPLAADYAREIVPLLEDRVRNGLKIVLEPGRTIMGNAGILLTRVLYVKTSGEKTFAICDGGMNVLLRPSHYDAFHFIWPARVAAEHTPERREKDMAMPGLVPIDVVGPICETGDFLAIDRPLPPVERGDLLAVFTAGAYGMVMASRYNAMPLPAEALVDGDQVKIIRERESLDDLLAHELTPRTVDVTAARPTS
ncbi:MAG: diaminopimelate decarboxylase [Phycisphaerales bacterium]|nr:MAG: diaminopimelate decarboxylase [Phycisphaerales bacterium]